MILMNINKILNGKMIFNFIPRGFKDIDKAIIVVALVLTVTIFFYLFSGAPFTIATPTNTNIKGYAEYLILPIFLVYSLTSIIVISVTLNKRGLLRKISLLGLGAGIFISYLLIFVIGNENLTFDSMLSPIMSYFAISFGSIASITILVSKFSQTTMKTSITSVIIFLIFFTFSAMLFGNLLIFFPLLTFFFVLLFSILTLITIPFVFSTDDIKYDGKDVKFKVINVDILNGGGSKKLVIKARKEGEKTISTLIPRTGRSLLVTDSLEPGDFIKCHYLYGGEKNYIIREMEKL
ncbi:MAG: hypothetical protein JXC85_05725 [Candidatus Aenigmarchaeota archaeon]|nr:hypothetical protein [Candidatus Aenigmarchaeota archaeon]